jgi:hypothetical protein
MIKTLIWVGRMAGILGLILAVTAVGARATGVWQLAGMQVGTLAQASIGVMVLAALAYGAAAAERM